MSAIKKEMYLGKIRMKMQLNILQTKKKKKIVITFKVPIVFPSRVILIFFKKH